MPHLVFRHFNIPSETEVLANQNSANIDYDLSLMILHCIWYQLNEPKYFGSQISSQF
jgi:hypothetical protein